MAMSELLFLFLILLDERQIIFTMVHSWLMKILFCFAHVQNRKKNQQMKSQTISSQPSNYHIFSSPLKLSMLRKVRCRIRSPTSDNNSITLPLSVVPCKQQPIINLLNESQNCVDTLDHRYVPTITHCKSYPSLIAIDISNNESSQEQTINKHQKYPSNIYFSEDLSKLRDKLHLHCRSLIKLESSNRSLTVSSHDYYHHHRNPIYKCLSSSPSSIHKQKSDSIIFVQQHRSLSNPSPHNINSITYDSTIDTPNSTSSILTPNSQKTDKTWRLKIHDELNKDGSRHFVMHKGSEESVRQRRQNKRAKRSEEKKRKIEEKVQKANQRWQKYSNIDYELVFFISRYYDQLPLCSNCRNYFITYRTQFLSEDPRASLDYAADVILHSPSNKSITLKQAAKSRLIKDYDKQTNIIFNLCDECLTKCEQIRNELKQINLSQKLSNGLNSPNINMITPQSQQSTSSPLSSPNMFYNGDQLSSPISPLPHISYQNISTGSSIDPNQFYINNLIQYHQMMLKQLHQQSQNMIIIIQQNSPFSGDQQELHYNLQSCIQQMQYHWLQLLHFQHSGSSLSFPYTPSYNSQYLSYRHQEIDDESSDTETLSSFHQKDNHNQRNINIENENDSISSKDSDCHCHVECDDNQKSIDDRLTIETCHGLVEYCNAPLDDFIRGLQVLKCLSNFNC